MRPYQNLVKEGKNDIKALENELLFFRRLLARYVFKDLELCETINSIIESTKTAISECKTYQTYLERMERSEYKAYISELRRNCEDSEIPQREARTTPPLPATIGRKVTWLATGEHGYGRG